MLGSDIPGRVPLALASRALLDLIYLASWMSTAFSIDLGWTTLARLSVATRGEAQEVPMTQSIDARAIHHITLTVSDVQRSQAFYEALLGFQKVADFGLRAVMVKGDVTLVLGPPPDPSQAMPGDRFSPNRVGLDHLSFAVASRTELERAKHLLAERGVEHKEIKDLGEGLGIYVLAFRDPDNIALELTAPYSRP
jgi:glyoxylase I family protein